LLSNRLNLFSVKKNLIPNRIDLCAGLVGHFAIDGDPSLRQQGFTVAPGADTGLGQVFLDSHGLRLFFFRHRMAK